jgi:hypothetical protein
VHDRALDRYTGQTTNKLEFLASLLQKKVHKNHYLVPTHAGNDSAFLDCVIAELEQLVRATGQSMEKLEALASLLQNKVHYLSLPTHAGNDSAFLDSEQESWISWSELWVRAWRSWRPWPACSRRKSTKITTSHAGNDSAFLDSAQQR